ncbi:MAG: transcription antitermination factor NusB [Bacteroidota bacterium]|jgi:N utilization substance protein B
MLNRRHLRIKALQVLYAFFQSGNNDRLRAEEDLEKSIRLMYHMYLYLILTLPELKRAAGNKIEDRKNKYLPTPEDLNPNLKWYNNALVQQIEDSDSLRRIAELKENKVNWLGAEEQEIFRKMFMQIEESEVYFEHMKNEVEGYEEDKAFAVQLFKSEVANSELLHHFFEENHIFWQDDLDLCCSMVIKTLKAAQENEEFSVLPLYKPNDDEEAFVKTLLKETIKRDAENETLINELAENWELDRIAKMDFLLLKMGITELQVCSSIPTKVTLNEYIEISKFYSTPKSNVFINGILDKAIQRLTAEKKIVKIGRGLMQ